MKRHTGETPEPGFLRFLATYLLDAARRRGLGWIALEAFLKLPVWALYLAALSLAVQELTLRADRDQMLGHSNATFVVLAGLAALAFAHASVISAEDRPRDRRVLVEAAESLSHGSILILCNSIIRYVVLPAGGGDWAALRPGGWPYALCSLALSGYLGVALAASVGGVSRLNDVLAGNAIARCKYSISNIKLSIKATSLVGRAHSLDSLVVKRRAEALEALRRIRSEREKLGAVMEGMNKSREQLLRELGEIGCRQEEAQLLPPGEELLGRLQGILAERLALTSRLSEWQAAQERVFEAFDSLDLAFEAVMKEEESTEVAEAMAQSFREAGRAKMDEARGRPSDPGQP